MTAAAAAVNHQHHHHQQTHHHHHHHHSSSRSLHSQVQDAVSITRDRIHDVVSQISKQPPVGDNSRGGVNNGSGGGSSNTIGIGNNGANGFKDGWDALVKIMFAPCVNIGGVPREEMEGATTDTPSRRGLYSSHAGRGVTAGANGNNGWGASVPFEVSASSLLGQSLVMSSSSLDKTSTDQHHHQQQQQQLQTNVHPSTSPQQKKKQQQPQQLQLLDPPGVPGVHTNNTNNTTLAHHHHSAPSSTSNYSPWEQRKAQSRAKLRQLGARHQLASGIPGESLADTARPITPGEEDDQQYHHHAAAASSSAALVPAQSSSSSSQQQQQAELVDFDDGISAISSHTLEEMERRREQQSQQQQQHKVMKKAAATTTTVLRLHPLDFSQIIDEDCEWKDDQVVVVAAATASTEEFRHEYHHHHQGGGGEGSELDVVEEVDETEVVFGTPFYEESSTTKGIPMTSPSDLYRVPSTRTHQTLNTTVTEDTHEFEDMCQRHEALYWTNQDQVASTERRSVSLRGVLTHQQQQSQDHHRSSTTTSSSSGRMSIEERARRLRELSRSRSRSDGSGSSNKSGASSLIFGQHPHDTIPLYPFDLFPLSKKSSSSSSKSGSGSGSRSRRENYYGSSSSGRGRTNRVMNNNGPDAISMMEGSDPFDLLECSEI